MTTVNIYLNFNGNCEEAFKFYKSVFGGEFPYVGRFSDMPAHGGAPIPKEMENRIMHISLPISQETILMGSDTSNASPVKAQSDKSFAISVNTDNKGEADRLFKELSDGGQITMPIGDMFWGDYFGILTDKFGINWMVNCHKNG